MSGKSYFLWPNRLKTMVDQAKRKESNVIQGEEGGIRA